MYQSLYHQPRSKAVTRRNEAVLHKMADGRQVAGEAGTVRNAMEQEKWSVRHLLFSAETATLLGLVRTCVCKALKGPKLI